MREYQPIWDRIKRRDKVTIQVPAAWLISRVVKAVIKEKDMDIAFKAINREKFRLRVVREPEKLRVTFHLIQRLGLEEKKVA
jgi:hypothetical protein